MIELFIINLFIISHENNDTDIFYGLNESLIQRLNDCLI